MREVQTIDLRPRVNANAFKANIYQDHLGGFWAFARGCRAKRDTLAECKAWARTQGALTAEYAGEVFTLEAEATP